MWNRRRSRNGGLEWYRTKSRIRRQYIWTLFRNWKVRPLFKMYTSSRFINLYRIVWCWKMKNMSSDATCFDPSLRLWQTWFPFSLFEQNQTLFPGAELCFVLHFLLLLQKALFLLQAKLFSVRHSWRHSIQGLRPRRKVSFLSLWCLVFPAKITLTFLPGKWWVKMGPDAQLRTFQNWSRTCRPSVQSCQLPWITQTSRYKPEKDFQKHWRTSRIKTKSSQNVRKRFQLYRLENHSILREKAIGHF